MTWYKVIEFFNCQVYHINFGFPFHQKLLPTLLKPPWYLSVSGTCGKLHSGKEKYANIEKIE